jgi:cell division protein FtsZ
VAEIAKRSGALTIAVVTKPFGFEGAHRRRVAEEGMQQLMNVVDTMIMVPNDRVLQLCDHKTSVDGAFKMADEVLHHGIQAISEVITQPGLINLDFADVRAIMKDAGPAWMSIGHGTGKNRAMDAAREALSSPLLDVSMAGARGVLLNIAGDADLSLHEVAAAADLVKQAVDPDANVIFGVVLDENMRRDIRITLVATGFATKEGMANAAYEKEMGEVLKGIKGKEEELDAPAYIRRNNISARYHS